MDDIVMTERVDNFMVGGTRVSVPCMGIFELRDGKISAWRDYWDPHSSSVRWPRHRLRGGNIGYPAVYVNSNFVGKYSRNA